MLSGVGYLSWIFFTFGVALGVVWCGLLSLKKVTCGVVWFGSFGLALGGVWCGLVNLETRQVWCGLAKYFEKSVVWCGVASQTPNYGIIYMTFCRSNSILS
jgi:hypothetical protein